MSSVQVVVDSRGTLRMVFDDRVDMRSVGTVTIRRGSHVEPTADRRWTADLSPVIGPVFGPFDSRREALDAEVTWLNTYWLAANRR